MTDTNQIGYPNASDSVVVSPYRGLLPYTEAEQAYFFGRDRDVELLIANVQTTSITVYYGEAGVGKSSVLMAAAIPRLRSERRTMTCLFRNWQVADLDSALRDTLAVEASNVVRRPVVFDPALSFGDAVAEITRVLRLSVILIFDQFEEYFSYHPESPASEVFEAAFARAANSQSSSIHFLLSMREDAISKLDRFQARIPNLLTNMLRLDYLSATVARECVEKPLAVYNATHRTTFSIELPLVDAVLRGAKLDDDHRPDLRPAGVEADSRIVAPVLQIVLAAIWEAERAAHSTSLRLLTLEALGGSAGIFDHYVDHAIGDFPIADARLVASLAKYLVNPKGGKIAQSIETLATWVETPERRVDEVLQRLASSRNRILRRLDLPFHGVQYELFHDVLGPALLAWRQRVQQADAVGVAQQEAALQRRRLRRKVAVVLAAVIVAAVGGVLFFADRASRAREREQYAQEAASRAREREQYADERQRASQLESQVAKLATEVADYQRRAAELEAKAEGAATENEARVLREKALLATKQAVSAQRIQVNVAEQVQKLNASGGGGLNEGVLMRLSSDGAPLIAERLDDRGITLRDTLDPLPVRITFEASNDVTSERMRRVRQIQGWAPGEFRLRLSVEDGELALRGISERGLPGGSYRLQFRMADHKPARAQFVLGDSEMATVQLNVFRDARRIELTSPIPAWDVKMRRVTTAARSQIDGVNVDTWLTSAHRDQRKASLLNILAKLRVSPVASRSLIDDTTSVFYVDDRQILVEVKPAFKDALYAMASEPNRPFYSEGRPVSTSALKILEVIRDLRKDPNTYLLTSFRSEGRLSLQIILAAPPDERSDRYYAALDIDDGSPLADAAGFLIRQSTSFVNSDPMSLWKALASSPAKEYLYYTVVESPTAR